MKAAGRTSWSDEDIEDTYFYRWDLRNTLIVWNLASGMGLLWGLHGHFPPRNAHPKKACACHELIVKMISGLVWHITHRCHVALERDERWSQALAVGGSLH
jgi:hypothetical protein